MLKIGNWPFWSKMERFDREINIEHKGNAVVECLTWGRGFEPHPCH